MASCESFQPWFARPVSVARKYSTKPSPSRSPSRSIQSSAASMCGQIAADRLEVARAIEVAARQHHEERRGVHAAVVAAERDLAERGHLAAPGLVQDLARLGVAGRIGPRRLGRGQRHQHAARDGRIRPEQRERREDPVAAEDRAEPRDPRVRIRAVRRLGDHHREVRTRPLEPLVHDDRSTCAPPSAATARPPLRRPPPRARSRTSCRAWPRACRRTRR